MQATARDIILSLAVALFFISTYLKFVAYCDRLMKKSVVYFVVEKGGAISVKQNIDNKF